MTTATMCPGCNETGWFEFLDQHSCTRVTPCACGIGLVRRRGQRAFVDVVPEDQWRAVWPHGLPVPSDDWCTPSQLTAAHVPPQMRMWTRATYPVSDQNREQVAKADAWIAACATSWPLTSGDALLFGSHGTGKTGLAIVMLRGALVHGCSGRYTLASDLLRELRQTYRAEAEHDEREVLAAYVAVDVLVLDELNVKATEFAEDTINFLIETRQRHFRPTLLTTNVGGSLTPDEAVTDLQAYLGPLVFDRLRERGQFWRMDGASLRPTYGATR